MYAFPYETPEQHIVRILGQPIPDYREFEKHLVFLLGGRIVYVEATRVNIEHPMTREVVFDVEQGTEFSKFSANEPVIVTILERSDTESYFLVTPATWRGSPTGKSGVQTKRDR